MQPNQNYVSNELTHFVGRGVEGSSPEEIEERRYALLLEILRTGWLLSKPGATSTTSPMLVDPYSKWTINEMFKSDIVCFCDIPIPDFEIHMQKYSRFGLSFSKAFLLEQGANPVFYLATDSKIGIWDISGGKEAFTRIARGDLDEAQIHALHEHFREMKRFVYENQATRPEAMDLIKRFESVEGFLFSLFDHFKYFNAGFSDSHEDNFYMEREWRLRGSLKFRIGDVQRIVIPKTYEARARGDLSAFKGNWTFVPQLRA